MFKTVLPLAMGLLLVLSACAAGQPQPTARVQVTATFCPVYLIAREVVRGVDGVELTDMAPAQAGCLHDYQLTMNDRRLLERSDVLLACGGGMERFLEDVRADHPRLTVCEAAGAAALLPSATGETEYNAHLWMSAEGAASMAARIAQTLGEADPAYAGAYRENADAFAEKVRRQYESRREKLDGAENRNIVIFHESFAYVARDFDLNVVGIIAKEPDEEPSAEELNAVIGAVRAYDVPALFADAQYDDRAAVTVSTETGVPYYTVDSLVGADVEKSDYLSVMDANYATLEKALCKEGN